MCSLFKRQSCPSRANQGFLGYCAFKTFSLPVREAQYSESLYIRLGLIYIQGGFSDYIHEIELSNSLDIPDLYDFTESVGCGYEERLQITHPHYLKIIIHESQLAVQEGNIRIPRTRIATERMAEAHIFTALKTSFVCAAVTKLSMFLAQGLQLYLTNILLSALFNVQFWVFERVPLREGNAYSSIGACTRVQNETTPSRAHFLGCPGPPSNRPLIYAEQEN